MTATRKRRPLLTLFASILALALLAGGWWSYRLIWGKPLNINHFADRAALTGVLDFPEGLSLLGMLDNTPLDFHSHRLSDPSPAGQQSGRERTEEALEQLLQYDRSALHEQQGLTYDFLATTWGNALAAYDWPWHFDNVMYIGPYPVNQMDGVQILPLTTLNQFHQIPLFNVNPC